jgi:Fic/DOC family
MGVCPPGHRRPCECHGGELLREQAARLNRHGALVDGYLELPGRWRGILRRQTTGQLVVGEDTRYEHAYNRFIPAAAAPGWVLRLETLQEVHDACAGGFDLRSTALSVRYRNPLFGTHTFPAATEVQALLTRALRVAESDDEAAIAATRLQLNLVTIHPFSDGNGRTARLAASMLLAHAGFRSSLLVAIEESVSSAPGRYLAALDAYRLEQICADACAAHLLDLLLSRSTAIAAWLERRRWLLEAAGRLGIDARDAGRVLADADRGSPHGEAPALAGEMTRAGVEPWHLLRRRIALVDQIALRAQATRLSQERADASAPRHTGAGA